MVLVLLLDLRYTSSVFSIISGRKCSLNLHLSYARRENDKLLPVNVEPPQGVSKVIGGLPNICSIPCCRPSRIFRTLRPKSVSSALVLIRVRVNNCECRDDWSRVPFAIVERPILPFDNSLDLQGLPDTRTSNCGLELPRDVTDLPLGRDVLSHPSLDGRAFAYGALVSARW